MGTNLPTLRALLITRSSLTSLVEFQMQILLSQSLSNTLKFSELPADQLALRLLKLLSPLVVQARMKSLSHPWSLSLPLCRTQVISPLFQVASKLMHQNTNKPKRNLKQSTSPCHSMFIRRVLPSTTLMDTLTTSVLASSSPVSQSA